MIDAETSTHTPNYILAELLDLPRDQEPALTDKLQFFDLPEFERTAAINTALINRPEMQAQAAQERIAHLEQESASEERLPQIDFSGDWLYQGSRFNNGIPAYTYQINFNVPLFTSGQDSCPKLLTQTWSKGVSRRIVSSSRRVSFAK